MSQSSTAWHREESPWLWPSPMGEKESRRNLAALATAVDICSFHTKYPPVFSNVNLSWWSCPEHTSVCPLHQGQSLCTISSLSATSLCHHVHANTTTSNPFHWDMRICMYILDPRTTTTMHIPTTKKVVPRRTSLAAVSHSGGKGEH